MTVVLLAEHEDVKTIINGLNSVCNKYGWGQPPALLTLTSTLIPDGDGKAVTQTGVHPTWPLVVDRFDNPVDCIDVIAALTRLGGIPVPNDLVGFIFISEGEEKELPEGEELTDEEYEAIPAQVARRIIFVGMDFSNFVLTHYQDAPDDKPKITRLEGGAHISTLLSLVRGSWLPIEF